MKLKSIQAFPVRIPLKPAYHMVSALGTHEVSDYVMVRCETESGIVGAGEASITPRWSGETVWGTCAIIEHVLAPAVLGCDPADIIELDRRMDTVAACNWFAKAAIEMACWDIAGKSSGQPVYKLLGGPHRSTTLCSRFSLAAYPPDRAARRAAELIEQGFETIKVKVGGDPDADVERVTAVREVIGDDRRLVLDANGGWDADTAIDCMRRLEPARVDVLEQPTPAGDFSELARVRQATGVRILADDSCFDLAHARELLALQACDAISVYPGKNGGIRKAAAIADLAEQHGVLCTIGSNLEWDVATAAMAHLVVGSRNLKIEEIPGDCIGPSYHEFSIVRNPLVIEGPLTTLNETPGLGVDVDWDLVRKCHP